MKRSFILFILVLIFLSCSNSDNFVEETIVSNSKMQEPQSRMAFSDSGEMLKTISTVRNMSLADKKAWSNSKLINSYFSSNEISDSTLTYVSTELKSILNSDLEFSVGDSILWYNNNKVLEPV